MKRARLLPVLALSASLVLSGCSGGPTGAEGAVIDGHRYSVSDIQQATAELNGVNGQQSTPQQVISQLVILPILRDAFSGTPAQQSEAKVRAMLAQGGLEDASDTTVAAQEARQYLALLQDPSMAANPEMQSAVQKLQAVTQEDIAAIPVEVNPRFGAWDPTQGQVLPEVPAWISGSTAQN